MWGRRFCMAALILLASCTCRSNGCGRSDDDDGGDDGMEPACKPNDQTCQAGEELTTEPLPDLREGTR